MICWGFQNFKAKLPKRNVKIFSRNFVGVIFSPKSWVWEFALGIWKCKGKKSALTTADALCKHTMSFWTTLLFSNPDGKLTNPRFWWKNNTYKILGKIFDVSLRQFCFKVHEILTNQNFQNVARTLIIF